MANIKDWKSLSKVDPEWTEATGGQHIDIGAFPDIPSLRKWIKDSKAAMSAEMGSSIAGVKERDEQVSVRDGSKITCRVYHPEQPPSGGSPLVVLYHGGGWCIGGLENEELLCRLLVSKLGFVAVNVDYRLAPEHKFPAAITDSFDATKWAATNASSLGADPTKGFIVGGTSAGGNITSVVTHLWRDEGLSPPITGQHLMIPFLVHHTVLPEKYKADYHSWEQNRDAPILGEKATVLFSSNYIAKEDVGNPLHSPFLFPTGHGKLPAAYFQVCGQDPLRDEALIFERILREDEGIKTKVDVYPGLPHGFWSMFPKMKASARFVEDSVKGVEWLLQQA